MSNMLKGMIEEIFNPVFAVKEILKFFVALSRKASVDTLYLYPNGITSLTSGGNGCSCMNLDVRSNKSTVEKYILKYFSHSKIMNFSIQIFFKIYFLIFETNAFNTFRV